MAPGSAFVCPYIHAYGCVGLYVCVGLPGLRALLPLLPLPLQGHARLMALLGQRKALVLPCLWTADSGARGKELALEAIHSE